MLLADVVTMLGLSRRQFTSKYRHIAIHRFSWTDFETQTMIADFKSIQRRIEQMHRSDDHSEEQRETGIESMSGSDFSDEDSVEVVTASVDLFNVLGIEIMSLQ